jgi:hypothetical protein
VGLFEQPRENLESRATHCGSEKSSDCRGTDNDANTETDMQQISTRQRILIRAVVLIAVVVLLAMFGLLSRNPAIVH